jgi:predicted amidophosphoribosyltransferase
MPPLASLHWLLPPLPPPCPLPHQGLKGFTPLPWWAAVSYSGQGRKALLQLRRQPQATRLTPLLPGLVRRLQQLDRPTLLLPIPSWKRRCNPLPRLLARQLQIQLHWPCRPALLSRRHPVLGQHNLNRELRWQNQQGAFHCLHRPGHEALPANCRSVLLVDDILTTGATACAAAAALEAMGWRVAGIACLGRTPQDRR